LFTEQKNLSDMEILLVTLLSILQPTSPTEGYGDLFTKERGTSPTEGYGDLFTKEPSPTEGYGDLF
jgi:hypothetical protein